MQLLEAKDVEGAAQAISHRRLAGLRRRLLLCRDQNQRYVRMLALVTQRPNAGNPLNVDGPMQLVHHEVARLEWSLDSPWFYTRRRKGPSQHALRLLGGGSMRVETPFNPEN